MKNRRSVVLPILIGFFLGTVLTAQVAQDREVALRNWPAALYWQPTQVETEASHASLYPTIRPRSSEPATSLGALVFVAMTPCRVADTRLGAGFTGSFGPPTLGAGATRTLPLQASTTCTIPSSAQAYSLNVTVVPQGLLGYLTMWPHGVAQPGASTLNSLLGTVVANAAIVPAGAPNGSVDVFASNTTDLVIDINGYYAPSTVFTLAQGTASTPSLSFSGDAGTGIFSSGTGALNFATGGTTRLTMRSDGDLDVPGSLRKGGTLLLHNLGANSLGVGLNALAVNTGNFNTANGNVALSSNTTGELNTATGYGALLSNTIGFSNTASGYQALYSNTTGNTSTAFGAYALFSNTTGKNTAVGIAALYGNTSGDFNTAVGGNALGNNSTGAGNTAVGNTALVNNVTGNANAAVGIGALYLNATGVDNSAIGRNALGTNTSGSSNTAVGADAGYKITSNNNIDIGNQGTAADTGVVRIGTSGTHTSFFAAGIRGAASGLLDSIPVLIDSNGQLVTTLSARRFKEDIADMADASSGLLRLRPVTYRYQQPYADGSKPLDYGLIAEEVADVFPELVVKNVDGQIETVQYHKLIPMLLNELQKLRAEVTALKKER